MTDTIKPQVVRPEKAVDVLTDQVEHLERALASRDTIGQAKGILMERLRITADEAFEKLRLASQHTNRKLSSLAEQLAATGEWPPHDLSA
jgi:AmiR/NasT family two-component response regulator